MTDKKAHLYEEGHKRETRKSYAAYLEEMTGIKKEENTEENLEDDASVRRSKRTPVPKRSFKLIDDYQSKKETPKKKGKLDESKAEKASARRKSTDRDGGRTEVEVEEQKAIKIEKGKRGRKASERLMEQSFEREDKPSEESQMKAEKVKKGRKSSEKIIDTKVTSQQDDVVPETEENDELTASRRSSRARKPKQFEDSICYTNKRRSSVSEPKTADKFNDSKEMQSLKKDSEKQTKKRKSKDTANKSLQEVLPSSQVSIKEEPQSDDGQPNKQSPRKVRKYESYITSPPGKNSDDSSQKVWTSDKNIIESQEPLKMKLKTKQNEKNIASPKKKKEAKEAGKNEKKDKRKSLEKLIVSIKKKSTPKNKDDKTDEEKSEELVPAAVKEIETNTQKPHKQKKKKKKKEKNEEQHENVKIETFPVIDKNIVKVKKKKIFKKKNGEKVLVRITKSHCNRNDEIVKIETFFLDGQKTEEEIIENRNNVKKVLDFTDPIEQNLNIQESFNDNFVDNLVTNDSINDDSIINDAFVPDIVEEKEIGGNQEENDPEYQPVVVKEKKKKKVNNKKTSKPTLKKTANKVIKKASRPANKVVTVGGKVIGKTTKGMKKTGTNENTKKTGSESNTSKNKMRTVQDYEKRFPVEPDNVGSQKKEHSEPKNAYNLFCRKYRPMIVQAHPKADFAEISRRLACLWNMSTDEEKNQHRDKFNELQNVSQARLNKLGRTSPTLWTDTDVDFIKKSIQRDLDFELPKYSVQRLSPTDMAAHLQLLGESLNQIAGALEQQASQTVHGSMSVLLDSMLCALAPLLFITSQVPEMNAIDEDTQARTLDNIAYILPGL